MNKQKGITLIALIVSIIVMLILVVVTITIVFEGGLIDKAKQAKEDTDLAAKNDTNMIIEAGDRIVEAVGGKKIIQPDVLYVPDFNEILTTIHINPNPMDPRELSNIIYEYTPYVNSESMSACFKDGNRTIEFSVPIQGLIEYPNDYYPDYLPYIVIVDSKQWQEETTETETNINIEFYVRAWENFTASIWDMPEVTYQIGWNKVKFNMNFIYNETIDDWEEIENTSVVTLIQPNELPVFKGTFTHEENNIQGKYKQFGYLMHPTWNYGIY